MLVGRLLMNASSGIGGLILAALATMAQYGTTARVAQRPLLRSALQGPPPPDPPPRGPPPPPRRSPHSVSVAGSDTPGRKPRNDEGLACRTRRPRGRWRRRLPCPLFNASGESTCQAKVNPVLQVPAPSRALWL